MRLATLWQVSETRLFGHALCSLQYGETIAVRLRLPPIHARAAEVKESISIRSFCSGLSTPEFSSCTEVFHQTDLDAVIYSDVLEYLDRENESR